MLGWGLSTRGGVRVLERFSHGGSRLTAPDAHVFEGGPSVLRWVHGVCFSLWWRRFVGGSLYLYDVEGSTRRCWTGSLVGGPCLRESFASSVIFEWLLVVGIVRLWGMNKGGLSAFDRRPRARRRPVTSTGARRRRARVERSRPPLSLWWLVSGSRLSRGRGSDAVIFPRSLAPLV